MSRKLTPPIIILCIVYLFLCPTQSVDLVKQVLINWYQTILPVLFPTAILVSILSFSLDSCTYAKIYCLLTGLFCGFPLGCTTTCTCFESGLLNKKTASILSAVSNQFSPVFIRSYVAMNCLHIHPLKVFLPLYLGQIPVLLFMLFQKSTPTRDDLNPKERKASQISNRYQVVDASIIHSCETMVKIGGYMILCSILQAALVYYSKLPSLNYVLSPLLETTSGLWNIKLSPLSAKEKYILTLCTLNFGGICGTLQVSGTLKRVNLSVKAYLLIKIITTIFIAVISLLYTTIFYI